MAVSTRGCSGKCNACGAPRPAKLLLHLGIAQPASILVVEWSVLFVLYFGAAAVLMAAWNAWATRRNRNRAFQIMHWIENAMSGQGHVTGIQWRSAGEFEVPLRLVSGVFRKAKVMVKVAPLELPLNWLMRRCRTSEPETLTFCADLDLKPNFALEMQ